MKEKPILFKGEMVRAIRCVDNPKSQTRREVNPQPEGNDEIGFSGERPPCPYGQVGDRLWVKETFSTDFKNYYPHDPIWYRTDDDRASLIEHRNGVQGIWSPESKQFVPFKWKPSIFMRRAFSRLTLEITKIRVERLRDISEEDAIAEGVQPLSHGFKNYLVADLQCGDARMSYMSLWESINGEGSWAKNPWVWVIEFKKL